MSKLKMLVLTIGLVSTILVGLSLRPANASSENISHAYYSASDIVDGSSVSLDLPKANYIEPANPGNDRNLIGVVVANNDSLIAEDESSGTVQVATSGYANALVSTLNGPISVGDQVSVSPFNGVGMKALSSATIIGIAQTAFNASTQGSVSRQIIETNGKTTDIWIGYVRLDIVVGQASLQTGGEQPNGLQKFSKTLTGHAVSTSHVIVSIVIAVVAILAVVSLIYASIYGGIISIGRNPLAKFAIFRSMIYVIIMAASIVIVSSVIIFLLLR